MWSFWLNKILKLVEQTFRCHALRVCQILCIWLNKNFQLVEQTFRYHVLCKENFLDLVNHVHSVETSWCGKNFRVVFDILFGDKF